LILTPKPPAPDPVHRLLGAAGAPLMPPPLPAILPGPTAGAAAPLPDPAALFPSLYLLLPRDAIHEALAATGSDSQRHRRLPAAEVVWLVIAQSWFPDRNLPMVWRHLHPAPDRPPPVPSAFTQARQRLGARPLQRLFWHTCRPLSAPGVVGAYHRHWLLTALDGTVVEAPDTPANRKVLGSAENQHGEGAFPQVRVAALCEVGTHVVTDVELGPYRASEQALSLRLLRRLPAGRLVLMDRGLSYFEQVRQVRRRHGHVLARVKVRQRALPVEEALSDGSYLSTIYPTSNARRARRGGIRVRVIRYTHTDATRDGCGEETRLLTTVLEVGLLSALEAVRLYPFRWEEESILAEVKCFLLRNRKPLLRGKEPTLLVQELYGLFLGHYLVRRLMAQAVGQRGEAVALVRVSFTNCLKVLEDRLWLAATGDWLPGVWREMSWQRLRPKRPRRYPRVKKATRSPWPTRKPGTKPPPQPTRPFAEFVRILHSDDH
jgi:Insertion element 4 transposase N-terminal/Transposase DDE domain